MIQVENLRKTYRIAKRGKGVRAAAKALFVREFDCVHALDGVTFSVAEGETVGYIGPNGAGKSTSIKVMCGILRPDSGTCRIMGYTPFKERKAYVQHIGVVFGQRTQLWWDVPVIDSYELLRAIYHVPGPAYEKTLRELTDALDIGNLLHTPLRQLSLGQRMRVELGASLLHSPRLLFLDEPTIGLDAVAKLAVRDFIRTIARERGVTVMLTTHDMNDIEALTDRIILIGQGKIIRDGSLSALRAQYDQKRLIEVSFSACDAPPQMPGLVCTQFAPGHAVFQVEAKTLSVPDAIGALSGSMQLTDVQVKNRPVEEIIAGIYQENAL